MNPQIFNSWFTLTSQVHHHQTRAKFLNFDNHTLTRTLFIHTARTTHYGLKLARVLGAKIGNSLPSNIRITSISLEIFKNQVKEHLFSFYNTI